MATNNFTCFPNLPAELRLLIWEEALSVRTVLAASRALIKDGSPDSTQPRPLEVTFVGPAPYLVGLSCREARRVMEKSYVQLASLRGGPSADHWVDLGKTVIFLGSCEHLLDVLSGFRADEVAQFKHLALNWHWASRIRGVERACREGLPGLCPALETLIVNRVNQATLSDPLAPWRSWGSEIAPFYAGLPAYTGHVWEVTTRWDWDDNTFEPSLFGCFPHPFPPGQLRLHVLGQDFKYNIEEKPWRSSDHWACVARDGGADEGSQE
jgi:hypothetical protein